MEVESVVNPVICLQVAVVEQEMCLVAAQEQLPTQVRRDRSPVILISCLQVSCLQVSSASTGRA